MILHIGLDLGSTTAKMVVFNQHKQLLFKRYTRHFSDVKGTSIQLLQQLQIEFPHSKVTMHISGSSGIGIANEINVPFVQEVVACTEAVENLIPQTDVVVELGGEDAKIIYLTNGIEQRMNSACAGGTGAFIDQMAALLHTDPSGLNELASNYNQLYPIASRCGVFAKTDVQPLLNEGVRKEDIAASIFQAVVNQTVSGLSCGRPIRGKVAFLGGPLTFLTTLRDRFSETLHLSEDEIIFPEDSQYFVAIGAAMNGIKAQGEEIDAFIEALQISEGSKHVQTNYGLPPLFNTEAELVAFRERHEQAAVPVGELASYHGNCFLGIDAGSTTTKIVLMGMNDQLLYTFYNSNKGNPLQSVIEGLTKLYPLLPPTATIVHSAVTGYGEGLLKSALKIDIGEIETVAHYKAAKRFRPDVDFILDIGGQDMKCIKIKNDTIDTIILNEACSSGCGSFLENFSTTLGMSVQQFSDEAIKASNPVDLGSRCTVFMNSKVKQVQKEGASISDLSAGLSYSVIKNALQKVIKLRNPSDIGEHVIVQGGTFHNEAVLRCFELLTGKEVIRPTIAGMMGAYGCALIAKERYDSATTSTLLSIEELHNFSSSVKHGRCGRCGNNCALTINRFPDKSIHITGNRCEKGSGRKAVHTDLPNLYDYKNERIFDYVPLSAQAAFRGTVGIPRVLNMFENYPLWHTFFSVLGYRVQLSPPSSKDILEAGMDTIPSESVCYPAKLAHGHIASLLDAKVDFIFYPSVVYEKKEIDEANNHFNCPVVTSYPEVIRTNMDALKETGIPFLNPFLTLDNEQALLNELSQIFPTIAKKEISHALLKGLAESTQVKLDIRNKGEEVLEFLQTTGQKGVILSGRPYHIDPEIHHGIPNLITALGLAVLTEDSVAHLGVMEEPLRVVNQWAYHSRLYRAAALASKTDNVELVQLTSFGCGIDAITADMVQEILENNNKVYTLLKIDEISNLGAARIRIRSLNAAMEERHEKGIKPQLLRKTKPNPLFTDQMRQDYTILAPQMTPIHFNLYETVFNDAGYRLKVLKTVTAEGMEEGLKTVNNDACYPAILTIGQIIAALKSGEYDLERTAVIMTQTGGGCRATNYIALLRKALKDAAMEHIPVISLNASGMEKQPGFTFSASLLNRLLAATCYGDLLMRVLHRVRPYEMEKGSASALYQKWQAICKDSLTNFSFRNYSRLTKQIVHEFDQLPIVDGRKPRVGIVGEILVKFHPDANNYLIQTIEEEGGEAVVPDFLDFLSYCAHDSIFESNKLGKSKMSKAGGKLSIKMLELYRSPMKLALSRSNRFESPASIKELASLASRLLSIGNSTGEGWLLTAEMMELIEQGTTNIVCVQPFGCLPNHIVGRGMMKGLKEMYPSSNIVSIDYDAGSSLVNQVNRIKLMMSVAFKNEKLLQS